MEKEESLIAIIDYTPSFRSDMKEEAVLDIINEEAYIHPKIFMSSKKAQADMLKNLGLNFSYRLTLQPPRPTHKEPSLILQGTIYRAIDSTTKQLIQPKEKFYLTNSPAEIIYDSTINSYILKILQFTIKKEVVIPLAKGDNFIGREHCKTIVETEISRSHLLIEVGSKIYLRNLSKSGGTFVCSSNPEFLYGQLFVGRITDGIFIKIQNASSKQLAELDPITAKALSMYGKPPLQKEKEKVVEKKSQEKKRIEDPSLNYKTVEIVNPFEFADMETQYNDVVITTPFGNNA